MNTYNVLKEFCNKGNLGSGLTYENGVFKATVNLNGYLHKNNLGEGLVFSNNKVNVDLDDEFNTIATSLNQLNTKVTLINEQLGTVYKVKGSTTVDNINSMTVGNAMIGYVYNLLDSGVITNGIEGELNVVKGSNIVYTEEGWDEFAVSLDLDLDQCAGLNISIENDVISAIGYKYDKEKESFSVGSGTATGQYSHAEGFATTASGEHSHAEGMVFEQFTYLPVSIEKYENGKYLINSHYSAIFTDVCNNDTKEYIGTITEQQIIHTPETRGYVTNILCNGAPVDINSGIYALKISYGALGTASHTEGCLTKASAEVTHAEGLYTLSSGAASHAEGSYTVASGEGAHAEGHFTVAFGGTSHAEGYYTEAYGESTHAEGMMTKAHGEASHVEGGSTVAEGDYSHAEGFRTVANNSYEHAQGYSNVSNKNSDEFGDAGNTIHSIGIGSGEDNRKNAQEVMLNGDHYIIGIGEYDGTNPYEAQTLQEVINSKVDKEEGKGLSTNDYTTEEKTKLEGIEEGALVNTVVSVNGQVGEVVISELTAGTNVDITDNTISALGYEFDNELNSFRIGREVTLGEMDLLFPATLSMGDTPTIFTDDVVASWQKGTNILQFTEDLYNGIAAIVPGTVLQLNTNSDKLICKIVDRDPELYKVILDKDIPFDYIENVSKIAFLYGVAYGKFSVANPVNTASGVLSHAGGCATTAGGWASHTEGIITYAIGDSSHAEGIGSVAYELGSHAEGMITKAYGVGSHTEGGGTEASGSYSHAEGIGTQTKHEAEHAEGKYNVSNTTDWIGDTIHSIGIGTSDEDRKNALEVTTQGAVYMKDVGGYDGTTLAGCYPILTVVNILLDSKNNDIPAINQRIDNLNIPTLPENIVNTVNGKTGDVTIDTSEFATTEEVQAVNTRIDELNIPADLSNVVTKTDNYQVTLGTDNNPTHEKTLLVGTGLTTSNNEALIVGAYNNAEYFTSLGVDAPAIQVGAGTEDSKRTVMVVQKNGKSLGLLGFEQNGFGDFAEYFEWADGNPEGEDRVGYMVLLNEDKIELAESLDNCIGIITGTGSFVADAACLDWHGRYLKDKWGRNIYALTGVLAENPEYDPNKEYIPREYRKEWSPVGLVGKILVRQDGTLKPNGFVGCVNGIATNVDKSSWRVLKVIDEEIALVLIK